MVRSHEANRTTSSAQKNCKKEEPVSHFQLLPDYCLHVLTNQNHRISDRAQPFLEPNINKVETLHDIIHLFRHQPF